MSMLTPVLGRSGATRCGLEKQVHGGQRQLTCGRETELMKRRQHATSGATNEVAAREETAEEPAEGCVLMHSLQGGEAGLLPVLLRLTLRSHWLRTKQELPGEVQRCSGYRQIISLVLGEENCWPIPRRG